MYSERVMGSVICDTVLPFSDSMVHEYPNYPTVEPQATFNVCPEIRTITCAS